MEELREIIPPLYKKFWYRIEYMDTFPYPEESDLISYAQLLKWLKAKVVKRINLLADGKLAIVEVRTTSAWNFVGQLTKSPGHQPSLLSPHVINSAYQVSRSSTRQSTNQCSW